MKAYPLLTTTQTLLGYVLRKEFTQSDGVQFLTKQDDSLQVAIIRHPPGYVIPDHGHHDIKRTTEGTPEVLIVLEGSMTGTLYAEDKTFQGTVTLNEGDILILLRGGHGFVMSDEGCEFIEVKQGPYKGQDLDKYLIETPK